MIDWLVSNRSFLYFSNCYLYNKPDQDIVIMGKTLEKVLVLQQKIIFKKWVITGREQIQFLTFTQLLEVTYPAPTPQHC